MVLKIHLSFLLSLKKKKTMTHKKFLDGWGIEILCELKALLSLAANADVVFHMSRASQ
ncbi:hypothetical protein XBFM1_1720005 [Xenorhabdus bovienii str. feltiae Moldova]|nr:hypothetical protein XBFM1_1720005 [Xenorhabdus bovienii str. feltiae Moldova]